MRKLENRDPYLYPSTDVLINKFDIKDEKKLQEVEAFIFSLKSAEPLPKGDFDYQHLKDLHKHFFGEIYTWAGEERTIDLVKGDSYFAHFKYISNWLDKLFKMLKQEDLSNLPVNELSQRLSYYFNEINAAHPFREGNGRVQRSFCELITNTVGYTLDWSLIKREAYLEASIQGMRGNYMPMASLFSQIINPLKT